MTVRQIRITTLVILFAIVMMPTHYAGASAADRERDPLASVVGMEAPQYEASPPDIFNSVQADNFNRLVDEARLFGIPLSLRVITTPSSAQLLEEGRTGDEPATSSQDATKQLAADWLENETIESSEGAADGLLLFIVIPEDDHSLTTAAFVGGENALPLNGVTQNRLDAIIVDTMRPLFEANTISQGINQGIAMLSYINLFEAAPRIELDTNHQRLQLAADLPLAVLTVGSTLGLIGLMAWIRYRRHNLGESTDKQLSAFEAGAITRGRIDESVTTGALLNLLHKGVLIAKTTRSGEIAIERGPNIHVTDPFEKTILATLDARHDAPGRISGASIRRLQDMLMPASQSLEDSLAMKGFFNRNAKVENVWIILGSGMTSAIALFTLFPSVLGMAKYGILAITFAVIGITIALLWATHRSFATGYGTHAQDAWLASPPSADDLATYDAIVNQDALLATEGGVTPTPQERVVRALRGIGTA